MTKSQSARSRGNGKEGVKLAFDKALEKSEPEDEDFEEDIHDPCLRFQK